MPVDKTKNVKRLPFNIQFSVLTSYFIVSISSTFLAWVLVETKLITQHIATLFIVLVPPLLGFIIGWWLKFHYVSKNGDDTQQIRVRAQFWGAMAFLVALIASLLLILIVLIMVESSGALPDEASSPITFILSMLILLLSLWIANNTKNRVYRNFGIA